MSLDVIRILMLTRGKKLYAAVIGFVEVSIFILALGQVLQGGLNDIFKVIAYAGGFATGNYLGSVLESKIAIGYLSLQIFPYCDCQDEFITRFREAGFGVTCVNGQGQSGERQVMYVYLKRKDLKLALELLNQIDPGTFYNVSDTRHIRGGVFK
ncbi:MAG: DUF2179 domain-containing protein [Firmicutes bacterium]|nr:DUF2179 domain-containing protein [Bacillota bacterium]